MRKIVSIVKDTVKGYMDHRCSLHAAGLTYFSLLTIAPLLCLLLLLARTCGAGELARSQINGRIDGMIAAIEAAPADEGATDEQAKAKREAACDFANQARTFSNQIFDKIDAFDVSAVGWIGLAMLLWSVVSTFGQVETAMNEIWEAERARPVWKRIYLYAFVALVLPLLAALASSLPILRVVKVALDATVGASSYTKWVGDALVSLLTSRVFGFFVTLLFATAAFAFVVSFMPNARVRLRPAIGGGFFTALLFGGWLRLCATAQVGIAKTSAMYGSFAFVPILLAWIYVSWQIVLVGANLSHAIQNQDSGGAGAGGSRR